jgi:CheY-like chemotaxis protein
MRNVSRLFNPFALRQIIPGKGRLDSAPPLEHRKLPCKMQPECAAHGEEALQMMRDAASKGKPYDWALLYFKMSEMDGLALS